MLIFETFRADETAGIPIYIQILRHVKRGIVTGGVQNGDELPSRRVLSALLGVNPMTIQKAYRALEEEGIIVSHTGAKSIISVDEEKITALKAEMLDLDILSALSAMKDAGLSLDEAKSFLETHWEEL